MYICRPNKYTNSLIVKALIENVFTMSLAVHPTDGGKIGNFFVRVANQGFFGHEYVLSTRIPALVIVEFVPVNMVMTVWIAMVKVTPVGHILAVRAGYNSQSFIPLQRLQALLHSIFIYHLVNRPLDLCRIEEKAWRKLLFWRLFILTCKGGIRIDVRKHDNYKNS